MSTVTTDPIADMLTRIRNAMLVSKHEVTLPSSKLKLAVARELAKHNFIDGVEELEGFPSRMKIVINREGTNPRITLIEKVSKPGRRLYAKADEIPRIRNGRGVVIVSTSQGIMSGREAKRARLGGELICKVY